MGGDCCNGGRKSWISSLENLYKKYHISPLFYPPYDIIYIKKELLWKKI
jgi:hypothetical protein